MATSSENTKFRPAKRFDGTGKNVWLVEKIKFKTNVFKASRTSYSLTFRVEFSRLAVEFGALNLGQVRPRQT